MTSHVASDAGPTWAGANELRIRPATDVDAARLAEFAQRTFEETFAADNTPENMAAHVSKSFGPTIQRREIQDRATVTLLAELGPVLAGFAQVRRGAFPPCISGPAPVEVHRFYVDRPYHGRGIAQALMRAAENAARVLGGETLWLGVWEQNPRAIAFYAKCGFVDVGKQAFIVGTDEQTDRVMARSI